jgi:hypothetical protein
MKPEEVKDWVDWLDILEREIGYASHRPEFQTGEKRQLLTRADRILEENLTTIKELLRAHSQH